MRGILTKECPAIVQQNLKVRVQGLRQREYDHYVEGTSESSSEELISNVLL